MKRQQRIDRRNNKLVVITSVVGIIIGIIAIYFIYATSDNNYVGFSPSIQRGSGGGLSQGEVGSCFGRDDGNCLDGNYTQTGNWKVFVTNNTFSPDFEGLTGADAKCNAAARYAGLVGEYVAWLSTSNEDAKDRIPNGRYLRVDGVKVADSKSDLLDGSLDNAISVNEYGIDMTPNPIHIVFTGTKSDGFNSGNNCKDWTSDSEDYIGLLGEFSKYGSRFWTEEYIDDCQDFSTVEKSRLYCFQVSKSLSEEQCNDGEDNDGDALVDYPNDPGCLIWDDVPEGLENTEIGFENYPEFFLEEGTNKLSNLTIVYGTNASSSDLVLAVDILTSLSDAGYDTSEVPIILDVEVDYDNLLGKNYITIGKANENFLSDEALEIYGIDNVRNGYNFLGLAHGKLPGSDENYKIVIVSGSDTLGTYQAGKKLINWQNNNIEGKKILKKTIKSDEIYRECKKVWTAEDLNNVRNDLDGCYVQMANIDLLSYEWQPIGNLDNPFTGKYIGNFYRIEYLRIHNWTLSNAGLFGVASGAVISDVSLDNVIIESGSNTGALIGKLVNGIVVDSDVKHGYIHGFSQSSAVGGLVGFMDNDADDNAPRIYNSWSDIEVAGVYNVGGLVGYSEGDVIDSLAISRVRGESNVGGLVGSSYGDADIFRSYALGDVEATDQNGRGDNVGGLIGNVRPGASVLSSFALGEVKGLIHAGGLAGENDGIISNSYSRGDVGSLESTGGFVGDNEDWIETSYSTGFVSGNLTIGGFAGEMDARGALNSFDIQTSGRSNGCGSGDCLQVLAKTTNQMKQSSTFNGWDFANTWTIVEGETYPWLAWHLDPDMLFYYTFDELFGDNYPFTKDSSIYLREGAVVGATNTDDGKYIGGLSLDGQDDFVKVPRTDSDLLPKEEITIVAYVMPSTFTGDNFRTILSTYADSSGGYGLRVVGDYNSNDVGKVAFFYRSGGSWHENIISNETLLLREWTHVAVTYDGSTVKIYINGELDSEYSNSDELIPKSGVSVGALYFNLEVIDFWDGSLDEVRVYNRALTQAEIQELL